MVARSKRPALTLLLLAALALAASAPPAAAASARALLQSDAAAPPALPSGAGAAGFGALFQGLPLKQMLGAGGKAFGAWRSGAKQLAEQKRDGADADIVGSDLPAVAAAAGLGGAGAKAAASKLALTNTTVDAVPLAKRLFVYNTTALVSGPALPAEPKDGKFTLLPAGCSMKMITDSPDGGEKKNAANACAAVKLEANAGSNTLEGLPADGLVSTDSLNATELSRDTVLTDFARLKLRYQELSLDDGVPGVPVPFDFTATVSAQEGARINGTAQGAESAVLRTRAWGMWTNGEPAIPLRSGIFTLVSSNATLPFELMGAGYTLRMLGLPVQGNGRARGGDDRLFVPTPRDALLGAAALRKEMGSEWARNMRVQSVYVPRGSPVKILMLPAAVELVEPSAAMERAVVDEAARRAEDAAAAKIKAARDAEAAVVKEVADYREALLAAAASGNATVDDLLAVGGLKEGEEGNLKRMPLPWRDDAGEGFDGESDAERAALKQRRREDRAAADAAEAQPGELFAGAARAIELVAQGVPAEEAERRAAEAAAEERRAQAAEGAEAAAAAAEAAAKGEEVYEDDDGEE